MYGARRSTSAFRAGFLGDEVEVEGATEADAADTPVVDAPVDVAAACRRGGDPLPADALLVAAALHLLLVEQAAGVYGPVNLGDPELRARFVALRKPPGAPAGLPDAAAILVRGGALRRHAEGYALCPIPARMSLGELERASQACERRCVVAAASELHDIVYEQAVATLGGGVGLCRWREAAHGNRLRLQVLDDAPPGDHGARRVGPLALPPIPAAGLEHTIGDPFPERGWILGRALEPVDGHDARRPLLISPLEVGALLNGASQDLRSVPRTLRALMLWREIAERGDYHSGSQPLSIRSFATVLRQRLQIADSSDYRSQTRALLRLLAGCGLLSMQRDASHAEVVLNRPSLPPTAGVERWRKVFRRWIDALPEGRHLLFEETLADSDAVRAAVRRAWVGLLQEGRTRVTIIRPNERSCEGYTYRSPVPLNGEWVTGTMVRACR